MKYYFQLQFKIVNRKLKSFGIQPILGFVLGGLLFVFFSYLLFKKISIAAWLYLLFPCMLLSQFNNRERNEFISTLFGNNKFYWIRLIENAILSTPFLIVELVHKAYIPAIVLTLGVIFFSIWKPKTVFSIALPTPFSKNPYEFTTGFRKTFPLFIAIYVLTAIAIIYHNYKLGLAAQALCFLVITTFYGKPEKTFWVWNYAFTPKKFLWEKLKNAWLYSLFLSLPIFTILCITYFDNSPLFILTQVWGILVVGLSVLAKYSNYPYELGLGQAILLITAIIVAPLLPIGFLYFYLQANKKLSPYLA